ncbi:hypothetical protein [Streptomyces pristinaespiralis]|uniref:hypothetical protein n=1 Tax=Streptomyces pristinaespiralis TaxID=38300 RepID=UPI0033CF6043
MTEDQIKARALAIVAAVAEDRPGDVDQLLADIEPEQLLVLVSGLAALALRCWLPSGAAGLDAGQRCLAAARVRRMLLSVVANDDAA